MPDPFEQPQSRGGAIACLIGLAIFTFVAGFFEVSDADVGFHVRTGELVCETGAIPSRNTFSFTQPDQPWLLHQWAPGVLIEQVWRHAGIAGLVTLKALLGAVAILLSALAARRHARALPVTYVAGAAVLFARQRFFERPFLFSAVLLAGLVYAASRWRDRPAWNWIGLPLLMMAWANLHAGVAYGAIYGACLLAADALDGLRQVRAGRAEARRAGMELARTAGSWLLALGAALVSVQFTNPHGAAVLVLPFTYTLDPFWRDLVTEFLPPTWHGEGTFFAYLGASIALVLVAIRRLPARLVVSSLVFAVLALKAQRSMLDFALVSIPCVAAALSHVTRKAPRVATRAAACAAPLCALAAMLFVLLPDTRFRFGVGLRPAFYPTGIYDLMRSDIPPQPVFNDMRYGGSLLWFLYPQWKPFIDGRFEAYDKAFWRDEYLPAEQGRAGWRDILARRDVHAALVDYVFGRPLAGLGKELAADAHWALVAFTDRTLLFLERTEMNRAAIERLRFAVLSPGDPSFASVTSSNAAQALVEARRAADLLPKGFAAQAALGRALSVAGCFAEAASVWGALAREPGAAAGYWQDYLFALLMSGARDQADRVAGEMITRDLRPGFAWYIRSYLAEGNGQREAALEDARRSVALEPRESQFALRLRELEESGNK